MIEKKRENSGENIHLASLIIKHGQNSKSSEKGAKARELKVIRGRRK